MRVPVGPPTPSACPVTSIQPPFLPTAGSLEPRVEVLINRINEVQQGELRDKLHDLQGPWLQDY